MIKTDHPTSSVAKDEADSTERPFFPYALFNTGKFPNNICALFNTAKFSYNIHVAIRHRKITRSKRPLPLISFYNGIPTVNFKNRNPLKSLRPFLPTVMQPALINITKSVGAIVLRNNILSLS